MENTLIAYMNKRLTREASSGKGVYEPGPVITISRETGCNGSNLARSIANHLNQRNPSKQWRVLSKEIFHKSAEELNVDLGTVTKIFKQTDRYLFEEILNAFSNRQYKSEKMIIKTVVDILRTFAEEGNCIILGRAGHIIAKDIQRALHIRVVAPFEYRLKVVMKKNNLTRADALILMRKIENERIAFRKAINEGLCEDNFDLTLNRASFDDHAMIELIDKAIRVKKILVSKKQKSKIS
ncbi:MAG: cytidylate kinase-like family protein [Chlorobi bacterium]|nr:cytidylate kinase-like family protein [Chlorobiota bacterium]